MGTNPTPPPLQVYGARASVDKGASLIVSLALLEDELCFRFAGRFQIEPCLAFKPKKGNGRRFVLDI